MEKLEKNFHSEYWALEGLYFPFLAICFYIASYHPSCDICLYFGSDSHFAVHPCVLYWKHPTLGLLSDPLITSNTLQIYKMPVSRSSFSDTYARICIFLQVVKHLSMWEFKGVFKL